MDWRALRLICFDLDDTLWPCKPVILRAEQALYAWMQRHTPRICDAFSIDDLRRQRLQWMQAHPDLAHDLTQVRLHSLRQLMQTFAYPVERAEAGTRVFRRWRNRVEPYADVLPVLRRLHSDYILVALSNGNAQLAHTPLAGCFHFDLSAADVGAAKPHPALFQAVAEWSGLPFERMLHVGDDLRRDIEPARKLGMATAWVHRRAATPSLSRIPDLCLFNLRPLLHYLPLCAVGSESGRR